MKDMKKVRRVSKRSNSDVLSGKARDEIIEKKKALRPKPASGKAVAVPLWLGQLSAA